MSKIKTDWHRADIVCAIRKSGTTMRELSIKNGYRPGTLTGALNTAYPVAERIIAAQIGVQPQQIWPSRYDESGKTNRVQGRPKGYTRQLNNRRVAAKRNLQSEATA